MFQFKVQNITPKYMNLDVMRQKQRKVKRLAAMCVWSVQNLYSGLDYKLIF